MEHAPFHMSLPCYSITKTKAFYVDIIGAEVGRNSSRWIDINLFGNQITFTKSGEFNFVFRAYKFGDTVLPSFHFGVIVDEQTWESMYKKLNTSQFDITTEVTFLKDKIGEHRSFFVQDPNGHSLEFKTFAKQSEMFAE